MESTHYKQYKCLSRLVCKAYWKILKESEDHTFALEQLGKMVLIEYGSKEEEPVLTGFYQLYKDEIDKLITNPNETDINNWAMEYALERSELWGADLWLDKINKN